MTLKKQLKVNQTDRDLFGTFRWRQDMNKIPNPFGQYQLIELLGQGSFSTVYRAVDSNSTDEVALKVLRSDFAIQPKSLEHFKKSAEQSAALNHPNIIKIH